MPTTNPKLSKKNLIKIILIVLGIILLGGGIFWIGKSFGSHSPKNPPSYLEERTRLENELAQLNTQLAETTDPAEVQRLQREITSLRQRISNLPSNNPNGPNNPLPPSTKQFTIKFNTKIGDNWEFISVSGNPPERFIISENNPILASGIDFADPNQQYNITFKEEEATEKREIKQKTQTLISYIFAESNDKFQLTLPVPIPLPGSKQEIEVKWGGGSDKENYWLLISADWPKTMKRVLISKKNPAVKGKKFAHEITPKLKISFAEKEASQKLSNDEWLFDENNSDFTLTPLENWPDDPNYQNEIEEEKPKTVKELKYGGFRDDYIGFNNILSGSIASNLLETYWVHLNHPEIERLDLTSILAEDKNALNKKKFILSFRHVNKIEHDGSFLIYQHNDSLEIKEKT